MLGMFVLASSMGVVTVYFNNAHKIEEHRAYASVVAVRKAEMTSISYGEPASETV